MRLSVHALGSPPALLGGKRPRSVFITQNGDWPAHSDKAEFRLFRCDGLICTNPDYFERNRSRYRSALIPNGVDLERFHPGPAEREQFGLSEEGPVVLMASALIASKNIAEGIDAVARIPGANLVVAGDGPLRNDLQKLPGSCCRAGTGSCTVPAADMPALYRSADAFLHLSTDKSFGNVFVEAMASGLPVVAYDTPRTRWIVGDHAFFADQNRPESLADGITAALQANSSAVAAMCERAQSFGWPAIAARYRDFFRELLEERK